MISRQKISKVVMLMATSLSLSAACVGQVPQEVFLSKALSNPSNLEVHKINFVGYLSLSGGELNLYTTTEAMQIANVYEAAYVQINLEHVVEEKIVLCNEKLVSVTGQIELVKSENPNLIYPLAFIDNVKRIVVLDSNDVCYSS